MRLTIDNLDGAGALDYTAAIATEPAARLIRTLNRPAELRFAALLADPALVVPVAGARVVVQDDTSAKLFTGYITAQDDCDYLGWGVRGPLYRIGLVARGDEVLLDANPLPPLTFTEQTPAEIIGTLCEALVPATFDTSGIAALDSVATFAVAEGKTWSEHAGEVARLSRATYRVLDHEVSMRPCGEQTWTFAEGDANFIPRALQLRLTAPALNDATIVGPTEPGAYVRDYFFNDPATNSFVPSQPFRGDEAVWLDERWDTAALSNGARWRVTDPSAALSVASAMLVADGETGADGGTVLAFADQVELGGAFVFEHGQASFSGTADAILGGLYGTSVTLANCFAGFRALTNGSTVVIRALVNGVSTGSSVTVTAGHAYRLRTRVYCAEPFRLAQRYHSSAHVAGDPRTAGDIAASVHCVLEVVDVDLSSGSGTLHVLWEGDIANAPAVATYAPVNAATLHAAISSLRAWRAPCMDARIAPPGDDYRSVYIGPADRGGEAELTRMPQLRFFVSAPPPFESHLELRYRAAARAAARVVNATAAAALAHGADSGVRSRTVHVESPAPRTSADCECAASALLDDGAIIGVTGEYRSPRALLPGDVQPGDAISFTLRSSTWNNVVRAVEIELRNLVDAQAAYRISFANDAAEPFTATSAAARGAGGSMAATALDAAPGFAASLPGAHVSGVITGGTVIETSIAAPSGGGFELRGTDAGFGPDDGANLIARFTTTTFVAPRTSVVSDYYLRAYDGSTPRRYSRYSTALHVESPL